MPQPKKQKHENRPRWERISQRQRAINAAKLAVSEATGVAAEMAKQLDPIIEQLNVQRRTQSSLAAVLQMQRIRNEVLTSMLMEGGLLPIGGIEARVQQRVTDLAAQVRADAEARQQAAEAEAEAATAPQAGDADGQQVAAVG